MYSGRFKFSKNGEEYEVFGEFGQGKKFSVVKLLPEGKRMLRSADAPSGTSGMTILATVWDVENKEQLHLELTQKYPGLTGFEAL